MRPNLNIYSLFFSPMVEQVLTNRETYFSTLFVFHGFSIVFMFQGQMALGIPMTRTRKDFQSQ